ncbi:MAG: GIY-YIG nuclease family protein [bacterium]
MKKYFVYILASHKNGTLYIGVTSDLSKRVFQHKNKLLEGFSNKYDINKLVYFEQTTDVKEAILREKQMKKWERAWKIRLIEENNQEWRDLYIDII